MEEIKTSIEILKTTPICNSVLKLILMEEIKTYTEFPNSLYIEVLNFVYFAK